MTEHTWLDWVLPITAMVSTIGAVVMWTGRKILFANIKEEIEEQLQRFKDEMEEKHAENKKKLEEAAGERMKIRAELSALGEDVAYLRGRASGTFRRPR